MKKDEFGDRMKSYERSETEHRLDHRLPIYARMDGRSFSSFTSGMSRPYDERLSHCMIETTKIMVAKTNAVIGYTQSDEISLVWLPSDNPLSQAMFDGKIQKLSSVLSGLTTSAFMREVFNHLRGYAGRLPHFDTRIINLPNTEETINMLLWRQRDAARNAIQMVGQHHYSAKELKRVSILKMLDMIENKGDSIDFYPNYFRQGSFVRRISVEKEWRPEFTVPEHLEQLVGTAVVRNVVEAVDPLSYDFKGIESLLNGENYRVADQIDAS